MEIEGKVEVIWHGETVKARFGHMAKGRIYRHQFTLKRKESKLKCIEQ